MTIRSGWAIPDPLRVVREAGLDPATEAAIFGENATQIFHLRP